ncbi:MAG: NAD(P)H-quinone oxidoreductase [Acidobacteriota bacterium]
MITRPGPPEVLQLREVPDPTAGAGEVLVQVHATALNRADLLQRRGHYPAPPGVPADIPGLEVAGEVVRCGPGATRFAPGSRVMALLGGGGYAEQVVVSEGHLMPIPETLSWEQAAGIPEAFLTAFDALVLQAHLTRGEVALIHSAASGIGTAAAQVARARGARVLGLARSAEKRSWLMTQGWFEAVFDPAEMETRDAVRGADVILDLVGAAAWPLYLEVLAPRGRVVVLSTMTGSRIELPLDRLMTARAQVLGSVLRPRSTAEKSELVAAFVAELLPLFRVGTLQPVIDRVLDWTQAAEAHSVMEANQSKGKLILTIGT